MQPPSPNNEQRFAQNHAPDLGAADILPAMPRINDNGAPDPSQDPFDFPEFGYDLLEDHAVNNQFPHFDDAAPAEMENAAPAPEEESVIADIGGELETFIYDLETLGFMEDFVKGLL